MATLIHPVTDVSSFVRVVAKLHETRWANVTRVWFRGHKCATHELIPTLYRPPGLDDESSAFNVFWARGRALRQFDHLDPGDYWDWYFAARHHGLPSRLLDWTANALVALYFATELHSPDECCKRAREPARVWMLDPMAMNELFFADARLCIPNDRDAADFVQHWLPSKLNHAKPGFNFEGREYSSEYPVAIYPSATNERLIAQQGMFTVHGSSHSSLHQQLRAATRSPRLTYIDIDRAAVPRIRKQLGWLGLNRFAVDADADGLAAYLADFYGTPAGPPRKRRRRKPG